MHPNRLRVYSVLAIIVACGEIVLCFAGPIAFVRKPSLLVFPLFSFGLEQEQVDRVTAFVEREIARDGSYAIVSRESAEDRIAHHMPENAPQRLASVDFQEARKIAQALRMERFVIGSVYQGTTECGLSLTVREARTGDILRSGRFDSSGLEVLLAGRDQRGQSLAIGEVLSADVKGVSLTDFVVLALLGFQIVLGLRALYGRDPGVLVEILWAPALILFLFAYIYARSANMDYMQRFIANSGQIKLAQSTAREQAYALLRYGPVLVLNAVFYVWRNMSAERSTPVPVVDARLSRYVGRWALPWVVLSGVLLGLAFPSFAVLDGLGFLAWFALIPLFLVILNTRSAAMSIFYGVVFGALQALIINYWHGTYNYVTLHLVTIAQVVEFTILMVPLVFLIRMSGRWGFLTAAAVWTVFDYARSVGVLGYPWALVGTTQYRFLPFIQIASITGVWGLGFVVVLVNAAVAWVIVARSRGWFWASADRSPIHRRLLPLEVAAGVLGLTLVVGTVILVQVDRRLYSDPGIPRATIVLVQQNRDPRKHEYEEAFGRLLSLTDQAMEEIGAAPDLVVWPEGAFKLDIGYWTQPQRRHYRWTKVVNQFLDYQKNMGGWLLTGTSDHRMIPLPDGGERRQNYNSSVLMDPDGGIRDYYHKMRLVPFTEHFPLDKERFAGLYELFQKFDISDWGVGEKRLVFQHEKMRFITPICFEDVFSDHIRRFVQNDVDVILNIGNDYWSLSPVEGKQHGILALFRAVENQRPVLRSTASGYTVSIDAAGRIQTGSPAFYSPGYLIAEVPLPQRHLTIYTRWGDWFPYLCALGLVALLVGAGLKVLLLRLVRWRRLGYHRDCQGFMSGGSVR